MTHIASPERPSHGNGFDRFLTLSLPGLLTDRVQGHDRPRARRADKRS